VGTHLLVRALLGAPGAGPVGATTDWISAVSTATLGLFGAAFAVWQFWAQGFRPRCAARIDVARQAIRLQISNRGRADGVIGRVVLVDAEGFAIQPGPLIDGYPSGNFTATTLPAHAAIQLMIGKPQSRAALPEGVLVKVDWGTGEAVLTPKPVKVGYAGLPSVLPPGSPNQPSSAINPTVGSPITLRAPPEDVTMLMVSNGVEADVAGPARTLIRWLLTLGAAALYAVLVFKVSLDVWVGNDPVTVDKILGGVMNSIALTFGSAFVGWFGVTTTSATVSLRETAVHRRVEIFRQLMTDLAGAAVFAMVVYLAAGAFAGLTYIFNEDKTPVVLITVATAWAAQASAVVAATLAAVLKAE